jgi:hypothetical protein
LDVGGERLLADDVLAGGHGPLGQRRVKVVRRADVHDVDIVGLDQVLRRRGRPLGQQSGGRSRRRSCVAARNGGEDATRSPHRPRVDLADEAGADDPGSRKTCHRASPRAVL